MEAAEKGGVGGRQEQAGPAQTSAPGLRRCIDVRVRVELWHWRPSGVCEEDTVMNEAWGGDLLIWLS